MYNFIKRIKKVALLSVLTATFTFPCFGQHNDSILGVGADSSLFLNNAALSMRHFKQFYMTPPSSVPYSNEVSLWNKTIIILNNDRILNKDELVNLEGKIISIKEIPVSRDSLDVERIILLKTR